MGRDISIHDHKEGEECVGTCESLSHDIVRHHNMCYHHHVSTVGELKQIIKENINEEYDCDCDWYCVQYWVNILIKAPLSDKDDSWVEMD